MFSIINKTFTMRFPNCLTLLTKLDKDKSNVVQVLVFDDNKAICTKEVLHSDQDVINNVDNGQWYTIIKCVAEFEGISDVQKFVSTLNPKQQKMFTELFKDISLTGNDMPVEYAPYDLFGILKSLK